MIESLFGFLFGSVVSYAAPQQNIGALEGWMLGGAANATSAYGPLQQIAPSDLSALGLATNIVTLPPGIFWERTGGKRHTVTIRREPETWWNGSLRIVPCGEALDGPR